MNPFRRVKDSVAFRAGRRLDRAAVSRAHDVFYESDAWTNARWLGVQALKNPLDLWVTGDNLRKGAALNGVQLAELMLAR